MLGGILCKLVSNRQPNLPQMSAICSEWDNTAVAGEWTRNAETESSGTASTSITTTHIDLGIGMRALGIHSLVGRGLVGLHRLDGLLLVLGFNGLLREFVLRHGGRLGAWGNDENMA